MAEPIGWQEAKAIGGMVPWACQYTSRDGRHMAITLYGTNPDQIEADHIAEYPDLIVLGEIIGTAKGV